jgi:hypothetical protein
MGSDALLGGSKVSRRTSVLDEAPESPQPGVSVLSSVCSWDGELDKSHLGGSTKSVGGRPTAF